MKRTKKIPNAVLPLICGLMAIIITHQALGQDCSGAPSARGAQFAAVWTGSEMIVWGGAKDNSLSPYLNTGGRYNPATDSWTATQTTDAPGPRVGPAAVWTGSEMIVLGGYNCCPGDNRNDGGLYNPAANSWTATTTSGAPPGGFGAPGAIWTGSEMIVWGGENTGSQYLNTGGRYNPGANSWAATTTSGAPSGRNGHTGVWTGSEMILWGGFSDFPRTFYTSGGRYNPALNVWTATTTTAAPIGRNWHTAIWTGSEMIVWGGNDDNSFFNDGGRYNPAADSWTALATTGAPNGRHYHTAVWTGNEMILWGGDNGTSYFNDGARYNPATDSWTPISTTGAPSARTTHAAVWTGTEMIVWGGYDGSTYLNDGGRYNPATDSWTPTGVMVNDNTPPTITCSANISVGCSVDLVVPVSFSVAAADNCDPSPTVSCTPTSGSLFPVGNTAVNCTAQDASGNSSSCNFTVTRAALGFAGFLSPLGGADATGGSFNDPLRNFKLGSTIPFKFTASCSGIAVTTGAHTLQIIKYANTTDSDPAIDATPTDAATAGNAFRYTSTDGQWHFNLNTKGLSAGTWKAIVTLSDGSTHYVWFGLKK